MTNNLQKLKPHVRRFATIHAAVAVVGALAVLASWLLLFDTPSGGLSFLGFLVASEFATNLIDVRIVAVSAVLTVAGGYYLSQSTEDSSGDLDV